MTAVVPPFEKPLPYLTTNAKIWVTVIPSLPPLFLCAGLALRQFRQLPFPPPPPNNNNMIKQKQRAKM